MRAEPTQWHGRIVAAALLSVFAACGDDAPSHATVLQASFDDPCRYAQCTDHGQCVKADDGGPTCLCNVGYAGTACNHCEPGFHTDALGRCAPDRSCAQQASDPCGLHGGCDDSDGVIMCDCDPGFEGPRCTLCQNGWDHDEFGDCLMLVLGPDGGTQPPIASDPGQPGDSPGGPSPALCMNTTCYGHGTCDGASGTIACTCSAGYTGDRCAACADGYHLDADDHCVAAAVCAAQSCGDHGACSAASGVITCACDSEYTGAACDACAPGFHADTGTMCAADQECLDTSCAGHGTCTSANDTTSCACESTYAGTHCELCATGYHHGDDGACVVDEVCATNSCEPHGSCNVVSGVIACACDTGYSGPTCTACATGYHDAGGGSCVVNELCQPGTCSAHSSCDESSGTVQCKCSAGYSGDACSACAAGYHRDQASNTCVAFGCKDNPIDKAGTLTFEELDGIPKQANNCNSGIDVNTDDVELTSVAGEATAWACAPSNVYGLSTQHVLLTADSRGPAQLSFSGPIATLSFDYGAKTALSLDIVGDDKVVSTLTASRKSSLSVALSFDPPISVLSLRSKGGASNQIAIDNVAYAPPACD